ncbi:hypothetical protein KP509_04G032600 [Ceratopteris richardii]|uniref:Plant bHLH transcription factor ACT-like domain-containing protein n=1 Tax=Ceratopteris richardii TaxID=49495 RepID=A0A8T2UU39_CERRI|nr:hypothetical protein KP509_04G032600 [Ceratopteris richardii]KAH7438822.1 hypothetical protein KP509_04G032600 [Ceratopteris richardii]
MSLLHMYHNMDSKDGLHHRIRRNTLKNRKRAIRWKPCGSYWRIRKYITWKAHKNRQRSDRSLKLLQAKLQEKLQHSGSKYLREPGGLLSPGIDVSSLIFHAHCYILELKASISELLSSSHTEDRKDDPNNVIESLRYPMVEINAVGEEKFEVFVKCESTRKPILVNLVETLEDLELEILDADSIRTNDKMFLFQAIVKQQQQECKTVEVIKTHILNTLEMLA